MLAINSAGRALLGVEAGSAVLRKSILPFVGADNHGTFQEFLQRVCGGVAGSTEFTTVGDSASIRFIEANAIPLPPHADKAETALLVLRDVTTRRRLEMSLEHVEVAPAADTTGVVAELESRIGELDLQSRQLTDERDRLAQAVQEGNATVDALARRLEERSLELNSVIAEREGLSRRVETTDATIRTLEAQIDKERLELDQLRTQRDQLAHSAEHGSATAGTLTQQLEHRDTELQSVSAERDGLARRAEAADATIRTLEAQIAQERLELDQLRAQRDHLAHSAEHGNAHVGALAQKLDQRDAEFNRITSDLKRLTAERDHLLRNDSRHSAGGRCVEAGAGKATARMRPPHVRA